MLQPLSFVTVGVSDFETEITFCCKGLGFPEPTRQGDLVYWKLGESHFALHPFAALAEDAGAQWSKEDHDRVCRPGAFSGVALAHNVPSEAEVDAVFARCLEIGASVARKPEKAHWGGYRGYVRSPNGHHWEICFNPFLEGP